MKIEYLKLRNFKAFRDIKIEKIPRLCVFIGANGSGKSTLFDVFGFLSDCLTYNVSTALLSRNASEKEIEIVLKFRMHIEGVGRLVSYQLIIAQENRQVIIQRECLRYKRGKRGSPYHFLDFSRGKGYAISNEEDFNKSDKNLERVEQELDGADILAVKGLGQFQRFKAANAFRQMIEKWHVSDFHINLARGSKSIAGDSRHLSVTGDNLQLYADRLFRSHGDVFKKVIESMKLRVPGIDGIETETTRDGRLLLKFRDASFQSPFVDKFVSDGTIKMFAYLLLLYDPSPHPLLCVEEPENQLYPRLLLELAEEFREYAMQGGQVFISTHSPDFLNAITEKEVFWLVKKNGYTQVCRAENNEQIVAYMKDGDQMGRLWNEGFLPGIHPS